VTHAYNHNYLGGRDQEDRGSKPAPGKKFTRPYWKKNPSQKKKKKKKKGAGRVAQVVKAPA
jgi:hypothetical protein